MIFSKNTVFAIVFMLQKLIPNYEQHPPMLILSLTITRISNAAGWVLSKAIPHGGVGGASKSRNRYALRSGENYSNLLGGNDKRC